MTIIEFAGEQLALEWGDIDWKNKFLSVERSYDHAHRKVVPTKTKKHRRVDISDELLEGFQTLRKDRLVQDPHKIAIWEIAGAQFDVPER